MMIGHRNRSSLAADGATGIPWVLARAQPGRGLGRRSWGCSCDAAARGGSRAACCRPPRSLIIVLGAGLASRWRPATGRRQRREPCGGTAVTGSAQRAGCAARRSCPHVDLAGLRWSDYHGVELPSSPAAGPRDTSGGLASGFADTPLGALLAALNIGVRANAQWGPAIFGPTIRDQVTGPDAAALLASCQSGYDQASQAAHITGGQPLGDAYVTEEAFRWVAYTPVGRDRRPGQRRAGQPGRHGAGDRPGSRSSGPAGTGGSSPRRAATGATRPPSCPRSAGYTIFPGQG